MIKTKVLFVCTENSSRSQMAEGFLRHLAGQHFDVFSGGAQPTQLNPVAGEVMKEIGIDISSQHSKACGHARLVGRDSPLLRPGTQFFNFFLHGD
jgi:protein-tyrosine-phosphatase